MISLKESDVAILVVSCDAYQDLWSPFFYCFFKYWPACPYAVYLGSNCLRFPDSRVRPILVGQDVDYSSNLLKMLDHIQQEWIILWIEDRVLSAPVNTALVVKLIKLAQTQQIGYLKLIASHPFAFPEDQTQQIGDIPRGARYRVCMTVALWNKRVLLDLLVPGETPWDIERRGSRRANGLDERFCSLSIHVKDTPPICDVHLIIKGRLTRGGKEFLERHGLLGFVQNRSIQTVSSQLYVKLYSAFFDLYSQLKRRLLLLQNMIMFHM